MTPPEELVAHALEVRQRAYAKYSNYLVGAALLTTTGEVITGCNVENASYGLTVCAERTAVFKAVSEGHREFIALAVATKNGGSMCGACRQVVAEFTTAQRTIDVYLADETGTFRTTTVAELLPGAFDATKLAD